MIFSFPYESCLKIPELQLNRWYLPLLSGLDLKSSFFPSLVNRILNLCWKRKAGKMVNVWFILNCLKKSAFWWWSLSLVKIDSNSWLGVIKGKALATEANWSWFLSFSSSKKHKVCVCIKWSKCNYFSVLLKRKAQDEADLLRWNDLKRNILRLILGNWSPFFASSALLL